jgi:hypothetical protein
MEPTDDIPSEMKPCDECGTLVKWPVDDDMVMCGGCVKALVARAS